MTGRTAQAALLCVVGLGLPLGGWFQAGSAQAEREGRELIAQAEQRAEQEASRAAERLAARLDALREAENRRPYYHYQNLFHDPQGASVGPSVVSSPLASGPADPLVEAYFQIDARGRVSLPTLNDDVPDRNSGPDEGRQRALRERLQVSAAELRCPAAPGQGPRLAAQRITLDNEAYVMNTQANRVYQGIKRSPRGLQADAQRGDEAPRAPQQANEAPRGDVEVTSESIQWRLALAPARLVGVRCTSTPDGEWTQGFLLSEAGLTALIGDGAGRLQRSPLPGSGGDPRPVGKTGLWLAPLRSDEASAAGALAEGVRRRFLGLFALAALAVAGAGALVVLVVAKAEALAAERSRFAASAAHELRTPLAGLRMYAEMLAEGLGDPARSGDYARRVALEAERLGRVVGNVLSFSRMERSTLQVKPTPGDLGTFVEDWALRMMPWAEAMGLTLDVDIEATPRVPFDPDAVTQILHNLLDNAEKYARTSADRSVVIGARGGRDGGAEFSVVDHGPGVEGGLRGRLFAPFARGADPDSPPGLGLGLSLCRALCRAHGGDLVHEPTPGGGATFRAWLPAARG